MNVPIKRDGVDVSEGAHSDTRMIDQTGILNLDVLGLVRAARKWMRVILGIAIGLTVLVSVGVFQITPRFTAEAQVLLDPQKTQVVDMDSVMSGLGSDLSTISSQVEILASRSVARRVIESENLMDDPEFNAALRPPSPTRFLDPGYWLRSIFNNNETEADPQILAESRMNSVIGAVVGSTEVSRKNMTYILTVDFSSEDRVKAARIANAIANTYVVDQLEAKFNATKQANEWLAKRLDDLRAQVEASERAVEIYRADNGLQSVGKVGVTISQQQMSELNAQLILAKTSLAEKQAKYSRAKQILSTGGSIESVVDVLQSNTISNLRAKEAELARQQAEMSSKYGDRFPAMLTIAAQRRDVERQIGAEVRRIVGSIQNESLIAQTRVSSLEGSLKELQGSSGSDDQASIKLNELEREAEANRMVYESFLNRYKETSQQQDIQTADARVISEAPIPGSAAYPKRGLMISVAFVISLMIGTLVAFLLEQMDSGIRSGADVEQHLGLVHLVSVPLIPKEKGADGKLMSPVDYVLARSLSSYAESLRSLRSALSLSNVDNPPKVILFTSALPNEGKTTTATSFARAAAEAGVRTILVDCDLRHPSVNKALGLKDAKRGIVEVLAGICKLEEVILVDEVSKLHHIPVAMGSKSPPDLLASAQMRRFVENLRETYDLVVIDSAPVLPVSDSRILSALVDKTVFVVRWNETPRDASQNAIKLLRTYNADIAGVALTAVNTAQQAKYGYGDGGYYYNRYSRYYAD